jgi:hypothetical protein
MVKKCKIWTITTIPRQEPLGLSIYTLKNEGQLGKTGLFGNGYQ